MGGEEGECAEGDDEGDGRGSCCVAEARPPIGDRFAEQAEEAPPASAEALRGRRRVAMSIGRGGEGNAAAVEPATGDDEAEGDAAESGPEKIGEANDDDEGGPMPPPIVVGDSIDALLEMLPPSSDCCW